MIAVLGSVLVTSLLGSPHCAGMCGGFVGFYAGSGAGPRPLLPHVAYNAGRLVSYMALGVIAGLLGAGIERMGATVGIGRAAAIVAGALMLTWGAASLLQALGVRLRLAGPRSLHRPIAAAVRAVSGRPAHERAVVVGLVTTLLPCGWLYAFVAAAGGTGSPLAGALIMLAFWLGTLPMMAGLGLAAATAFAPLKRRLPAATALVLIAMGLLTVAGKMHPLPGMLHAGTHVCH